jgi:hypothetical protein
MKKAKSRKPARKKAASKSKSRKPVDLQAIREAIVSQVGVEAAEMTDALVEEAKKGQLAPTKFLFEIIGLYPARAASGDNEQAEDEEAEEGNDLASVLLRRLSLPEPDESSESTAELEVANACAGNSVE